MPRLERGASLGFCCSCKNNSVTWPTLESKPRDEEVTNKNRKLTTVLVVLQVLTSLSNMLVIANFQNPQLVVCVFVIHPELFVVISGRDML